MGNSFQSLKARQVSSGGGLLIEGPLGFEFPTACQPEAGLNGRKVPPNKVGKMRFKGSNHLMRMVMEPKYYAFRR